MICLLTIRVFLWNVLKLTCCKEQRTGRKCQGGFCVVMSAVKESHSVSHLLKAINWPLLQILSLFTSQASAPPCFLSDFAPFSWFMMLVHDLLLSTCNVCRTYAVVPCLGARRSCHWYQCLFPQNCFQAFKVHLWVLNMLLFLHSVLIPSLKDLPLSPSHSVTRWFLLTFIPVQHAYFYSTGHNCLDYFSVCHVSVWLPNQDQVLMSPPFIVGTQVCWCSSAEICCWTSWEQGQK